MWRKVWLENGTPPGGESLFEVADRMAGAYATIAHRHTGEHVALVSHGGSLNLLIANIIGLPLGQSAKISLRGNTGLSMIKIGDREGGLVALNDIHHLRSALGDLEQALPSPAETS